MSTAPQFDTITGDDWRRSLIAGRHRRSGTASRICSQIPTSHLMSDTTPTTPSALYSREIPASEVIAQLKAQLEAAHATILRKDEALHKLACLGNEPHFGNSEGNDIALRAWKITFTDVKQSIAEDTARLDWLEQTEGEEDGQKYEVECSITYNGNTGAAPLFPATRAGIDAARKASA